ncbi:hypothetical protein Tsubulata_027095, partial [Turnera subulata]
GGDGAARGRSAAEGRRETNQGRGRGAVVDGVSPVAMIRRAEGGDEGSTRCSSWLDLTPGGRVPRGRGRLAVMSSLVSGDVA